MDNCSIAIANLGLHYDEESGLLSNYNRGRQIPSLDNDLRAMIAYLVDFDSTDKNRVAIYRSALPQHFDSKDGHYEPHKACSPQSRKIDGVDNAFIQKYNQRYSDVFSKMCVIQSIKSSACDSYVHTCSANIMDMVGPTVHNYYIASNCCEERLQKLRQRGGSGTITGTILRWSIADLFDQPSWHAARFDCSHFCYIPAMYEAAFERLELLLPPLV